MARTSGWWMRPPRSATRRTTDTLQSESTITRISIQRGRVPRRPHQSAAIAAAAVIEPEMRTKVAASSCSPIACVSTPAIGGLRFRQDVGGAVAGPIRRVAAERGDDRHHQAGRDQRPVAADRPDQQQEERERLRVERRVVDGEVQVVGLDHFFSACAAASVASFSAFALIGGLYAAMPVTASPMMRLWMSCVPSYVFTDSRFIMWRITGYSSDTPFAPRMSRAMRADSRAMLTLFILPIETWCGFSLPWSFNRPICSARSWPFVISVIIHASLFCTSWCAAIGWPPNWMRDFEYCTAVL